MDINRSRLTIVSLFMITICFWLLPLSAHAASRGISVISDLSHQSGKLGSYRALLIGINDYNDPKIPDLETAVNDASAMAKLLRKRYGFKVKLLLDRKATKKAIYRALRSLASSTKPDDSILIYYAGHGDLDRLTNDGWWIPADAKGGDSVTYLNNFLVQTYIRSMKARHVLLVSDSCYSGTLFGQARALPQVIDDKYYLNLYNEKSRWGMTSGNKTPVSDRGTGSHSVFAYQLLKELRKNEKPYISTQEIYTRIAPTVSNNSEQTPLCRPIRNTGDQGGEFVFVASSSAIVEKPSPKSLKAYLSVESNVSDARVLIDGRYVGTTNLSNVEVVPGEHQIRVENEGYEPYTKRIRFEVGRIRDLYVVLDPKAPLKGRLYVDTQPDNANVRILNIVPAFNQGMALDAGRYHVEVSADGYETQKMWVSLTAGEDKRLDIHLDKTELRKETIEQLKNRGEVTRGWLGVGIQDISKQVAEYYGIKSKKGVLVTEVFPDDPADIAGIKPQDIILSINGKEVGTARELTSMIADTGVGETVKIKVLRNGKTRTFKVKITKREETIEQLKNRGEVTRGWLGVGIQDISKQIAEYYGIKSREGVLVMEVFPDDPADIAGIKPQDIILSINGKEVGTARELTSMIADTGVGETVKIKVLRNGKTRTFKVKITKREETKISARSTHKEKQAELGISVNDVTPEIARRLNLKEAKGVIVTAVEPDSKAEIAGVMVDDIIKEINHNSIITVSDLKKVVSEIKKDETIHMFILRMNRGFLVLKMTK